MKPIIESILDTDLYKLTMQQAIRKYFPHAVANYKFTNRGGTDFPEGFSDALWVEVQSMGGLRLLADEWQWLKAACPYLSEEYRDYLMEYRFDPSQVKIRQLKGTLYIDINGPWRSTTLWEVPLMATISELYFRMTEQYIDDSWDQRAMQKASIFRKEGIKYADFGTRRRYSRAIHEAVVPLLAFGPRGTGLVGTSNPKIAKMYNLRPVGTYAHEWVMGIAAEHGVRHANMDAMDFWSTMYRGELGIALTDTFTTDVFLKDFDGFRARLFDGVRQDSGDPLVFAAQMVGHYQNLGIDPHHKTIVFSDSLDMEKVRNIQTYCKGKINTIYGIGTNLTNDVGVKPLNMVIKLTKIDGRDVVKLSDDPGKRSGDPDEIARTKRILGVG